MHQMKTIVVGKDIRKVYGSGDAAVHALRGVDFEVYSDEFVVILGPSGSGKSTLLNVLGGIETATSGELFYEGEPVNWQNKAALTEYRRDHIGFIFQFYNLLPGLNAVENVQLAAELGREPFDPDELIEAVGLGDRKTHFPSTMSGGQQQRVAIARALCKNPDLLLCDEPTGALDSKTSIQVLQLLVDFKKKYHKSVLMVTHNADFARIADRVFYFKDGMIDNITVNENPLSPAEL